MPNELYDKLLSFHVKLDALLQHTARHPLPSKGTPLSLGSLPSRRILPPYRTRASQDSSCWQPSPAQHDARYVLC